jgi:selenocysteine-specific elongation factor
MNDLPSLVLGTAGHIDHGKTALITLLTGTNTDRLREERERGISIELGYAQLELPSGRRLSVVDVPGHERFVRTMVAGATGIDVFLLVVAADDGVMPQTVEHLAIIDLLGVPAGVVALTKADLVDDELLEMARADVEGLLVGTRHENVPIVPVSARDGRGVPQLLGALEEAAAGIEGGRREGPARLPVDRVFTLKGIGTVATGTLWRGEVRAGDELVAQPGGRAVTVRDVQVHEHDAEVGCAGQRVGLNLRGAEKAGLQRGGWLAAPAAAARATAVFDAWVRPLPGAPALKAGEQLRIHHGTGQFVARLQLLDRDVLDGSAPAGGPPPGAPAAGESPPSVAQAGGAPVRVRLESATLVEPHDRFILRLLSPVATVGGGVVLDADARRWHGKEGHARFLAAVHAADTAAAVSELAAARGPAGIVAADLTATAVGEGAASVLRKAAHRGVLEEVETAPGVRRWFVPGTSAELESSIERILERRAADRPDRPLLSLAELTAALGAGGGSRAVATLDSAADPPPAATSPAAPADVVAATAAGMVAAGRLVRTDAGLAHPSAGVLSPEREKLAAVVLAALAADRFSPPTFGAMQEDFGGERRELLLVLDVLARRGEAVRVKEDLWFTTEAVDEARDRLQEALAKDGAVTLSGFRDLLQCGRRNAQALLEHFDGEGLTRRVGEQRVARRQRA